MEYTIREATNADAHDARRIVFSVLEEFGLSPDPCLTDADLEDIESNYRDNGGSFKVIIGRDGQLIGCGGILRLTDDECELRKMYLRPEARGRGIGKAILNELLSAARDLGFRRVVLETASVLEAAIRLYQRAGFQPVPHDHLSSRCDQGWSLDL